MNAAPLPAETTSSTDREPVLVRRVRWATYVVWAALMVVLAALTARVVLMLALGVNGDWTSNSHFANRVYTLTAPISERFWDAAWVKLPINGTSHLLDLPTLIAMDLLFFGVLALTKVALWSARWYSRRRERRRSPQLAPAQSA